MTAATLISPTLAALQSIERDYDHGMADIHRHYRRQLDALFAADINQLLPVQPVSPHTTEPPPHEVTWRRWQDARQHGHTAPLSIHVSREDIQTPPPGGWVPRKPAYPLAQARDVNGAAVEVDRDAADDMTRYWHADTSSDMPGTVVPDVNESPLPSDDTYGGWTPGVRLPWWRRAADTVAWIGRH